MQVTLLFLLLLLPSATLGAIVVFRPQPLDIWFFDGSESTGYFLDSGYVVRWFSDRGETQTATIEIFEDDPFTNDATARLTSGSGTSNAKEVGEEYAEFSVGSGIELTFTDDEPYDLEKFYLRVTVSCSGFLCSTDRKDVRIDLKPRDPCKFSRFHDCPMRTACRKEQDGEYGCYCITGNHLITIDGSKRCHNCSSRPACPLHATCDPSDATCYCDNGYVLNADGDGCEIDTRPPSLVTPRPTPESSTCIDGGCQNIWRGDGTCDSPCNNAACAYDNGDCRQAPDPNNNLPLDLVGGCLTKAYCDAKCGGSRSALNNIGSCCPDCRDGGQINFSGGVSTCVNPTCPSLGATPKPTPTPTTPKPTPVSVDICVSRCASCSCFNECCEQRCAQDRRPLVVKRCSSFNGQIVETACQCGPAINHVSFASRAFVGASLSLAVAALV